MNPSVDTIAAIATPPGRGGVGIIRISGPGAVAVAAAIAGMVPLPRRAGLRDFSDAAGTVIDRGLVVYFPAPDSFTGEHVVELQAHGGPVLLELLLVAACAAGARRARPGEFSERAYLNGRLDLVQAESIADLIDAASVSAVRAASRSLHGEFSQAIGQLVDQLMALRADLEAALDFADEDVPWIDDKRMASCLSALQAGLIDLQRRAAQGRRLRDGLVIAIVGRPNVGKSTLLNALAHAETAIVSPIAGTTRDVLREHLLIDELPITLIDTAGLRETTDSIEAEGVRRAWIALRDADVILFVLDAVRGIEAEDQRLLDQLPPGPVRRLLFNKCDLADRSIAESLPDQLRLSAATGEGLDALKTTLKQIAGLHDEMAGSFSARARHLDALARAAEPISRSISLATAKASSELIAEELQQAQIALGEITGRVSADDLLGRIFSTFCLGK